MQINVNDLAENLGFEEPKHIPLPRTPDLNQSADPTAKEGNFKREEVEELAKNSLDFLAALAMPLVFRYFFPPLFKAAWTWLLSYVHKERDFSQLALGLPRGFAKTTFIKIFLLYVILFTKRTFILICANNQDKANAIVADVMDFLNEPNIKKVFGDWKLGVETDQQKMKKFGFRGRNINIVAGTVDTVRGLNLKHQRPDIMIFDDIQSRQDAESEVISKQIETDLYGTAMKAKSPHGCLFIFVGNMYPTKHSLLRKLKSNKRWLKFIVGGILANGESLWEELQPKAQLIAEYENDLAAGQPHVFFAEVLNDENASANHLVDLTKVPEYTIADDEPHQGNFIVIDPANNKKQSDSVCITYFEVHDTKPYAKEIINEGLSPGDNIKKALTLALRKNCRVIAIESNGYQYSLLYWFDYFTKQWGIAGIQAVEIYSGSHSKPARIAGMFKQLINGEVGLHPDVRPLVYNEISNYNPLKIDNVDNILDCLTYPHKVIELYGHLIAGYTIDNEQENAELTIVPEIENSPF